MDILTPIVTAISAGAAASLKDTTTQAVKDAYAGIKALIQKKFGSKVSIDAFEQKPTSEAKKAALKEELEDAGAHNDSELFEALQKLVTLIKEKEPQGATGVNISEVEAEFIKIGKVKAIGTGISITKSKLTGGIDIGEVDAGTNTNPI